MTAGKVAFGALALLALACTPNKTGLPLRSLESSGRTSFLCWGADHAPRPLEDCPDQIPYSLDHEDRDWIALVTQTTRGEVAVVDITAGSVLDEEPSVPGYNFLTIGKNPVSIVSTPGSVASFVGVAEVGREGIYAIPTSCAAPRTADQPLRDILTWPACRLPSAPGEMAVIVDPETPQGVRVSCDDPARVPAGQAGSKAGAGADCPADLSTETTHPGRRKLLVTLPSRSLVAVIDAQEILDRTPGKFDPCPIERYTRLGVNLPSTPVAETLPPDMQLSGCTPPAPPPPPDPADFAPLPAGLASDPTDPSGPLYVADLGAPVVHVLDVADPCAIREEPPLLPVSFKDPSRVVYTRKVALSPRTSTDQRYLYAVDELDAGSVMIFDVGSASASRTPVVRPRSPLMPFEAAPDRIAFDSPVVDVAFAKTDRAVVDPTTGNTIYAGVECDPDPRNAGTPGSLYRPAADSSTGAQPGFLRGVFGFLALSSGQLAIIDVEDLDAKCRRPVTANPDAVENFFGCAGDDPGISSFANGTTATVTGERTCHVVESHRARSAVLIKNDVSTGVRSPSLLTSPKLTDATGRTLPTDRSAQGLPQPRMLGVDFSSKPGEKAQVYIGTTLNQRGDPTSPLVIDPALADNSSLVLNLAEPRSYPRAETVTARYEGTITGERVAARFQIAADGSATLSDSGISFCATGVEDENVAAARAADLGVDPAGAAAFARRHADYVQITSEIPAEGDAYWSSTRCGNATSAGKSSYLECRTALGTKAALLSARELRVISATTSGLAVEPREATTPGEIAAGNELLACCFPGVVSYVLRASKEWVVTGSISGLMHGIIADASGACVRDTCDPMKSRLESRAFEVSCADPDSCPKDAEGNPAIGSAEPGEAGCVLPASYFATNPTISPVLAGAGAPDALQRCIFRSLTSRFVIYRGVALPPSAAWSAASQRDMQFTWDVAGTFVPFTVNLAVNDTNTSLQSLVYAPYAHQLVLTDSADQGLLVLDLTSLAPRSYY